MGEAVENIAIVARVPVQGIGEAQSFGMPRQRIGHPGPFFHADIGKS